MPSPRWSSRWGVLPVFKLKRVFDLTNPPQEQSMFVYIDTLTVQGLLLPAGAPSTRWQHLGVRQLQSGWYEGAVKGQLQDWLICHFTWDA